MATATFVCPECDTALRGADKVPAGKKVKCPSCSAIFVMPEQKKMESSVAIRDKPLPTAPARPIRDDEDDRNDGARRPKRKLEKNDEDEVPRRRKGIAAEEEFEVVDEEDVVADEYTEDDDAVEDRPRKKRRKKKAVRRGSRKGLLVGLIAGISVLVLAALGIGGYFLFFAGSGIDAEPWVFVQSDANIIVNLDVAALMKDSTFGPQIEQAFQRANTKFAEDVKKETGLEVKELFAQTVFAMTIDPSQGGNFMAGLMGMGQPPPMTVALKASKSFSQSKLVKSFKNPKEKKINGKTYYEVDEKPFKYAFMPSNRLLIMTSAPEGQLAAMLDATNNKPTLPADTVAMIRGMEKNTLWVAMSMAKLRPAMEEAMAMQPPAFKPMADAMLQAKAFGFWASLDANALRMGASVACTDVNTASQLVNQGEAALQQMKGDMGPFEMFLGQLPNTKQALKEYLDSTKYKVEGSMMLMTAQISRQTLNEAVKEIQGMAGNFGGGMGRGGGIGGQQGGGMGPGRGIGGGKGGGMGPGGGIGGGKGGGRRKGGG